MLLFSLFLQQNLMKLGTLLQSEGTTQYHTHLENKVCIFRAECTMKISLWKVGYALFIGRM